VTPADGVLNAFGQRHCIVNREQLSAEPSSTASGSSSASASVGSPSSSSSTSVTPLATASASVERLCYGERFVVFIIVSYGKQHSQQYGLELRLQHGFLVQQLPHMASLPRSGSLFGGQSASSSQAAPAQTASTSSY
jgi:hypothetical protein